MVHTMQSLMRAIPKIVVNVMYCQMGFSQCLSNEYYRALHLSTEQL
jgi:hypothetical protein